MWPLSMWNENLVWIEISYKHKQTLDFKGVVQKENKLSF